MINDNEEYKGNGVLKFKGEEVMRVKLNKLVRNRADTAYDTKESKLEIYRIGFEFDISDKRFIERRNEIDEIIRKIGRGEEFELELNLEGVDKTFKLDKVHVEKEEEIHNFRDWSTKKFLCNRKTLTEI